MHDYNLRSIKNTNIDSSYQYNQATIFLQKTFACVAEEDLQSLLNKVQWIYLEAGAMLIEEGHDIDGLYILVSGRLQAVKESEYQESEILGEILGEVYVGECVGEMGLITQGVASVSIYAVRDSLLIKLSKADFEKLTKDYPELYKKIAETVIRRLRISVQGKPAPKRLNIVLLPASTQIPIQDFCTYLQRAFSALGKTGCIDSNYVDKKLSKQGISQVSRSEANYSHLTFWLDQESAKYAYCILLCDLQPSEWNRRCIRQADHILLVADANSSPIPVEPELLLAENRQALVRVKKVLVLLHKPTVSRPTATKEWLDRRPQFNHVHIRQNLRSDFDRLARIITGQAIGLVLAGGGAKGFAHIGVVRALHEANIPIDLVGGTSMGAIMGAGIAEQRDWHGMMELAHKLIKQKPWTEYTLPIMALLKGNRYDKVLHDCFTEKIEDLWLTFFCVSCNISEFVLHTHRRGELWRALRASSSLPGILPPILDKKQLFVDGGLVNNLPVDIMRDSFPCRIIAVDLNTGEESDCNLTRLPSSWELFWQKMNPFAKQLQEVPLISDVLMRSVAISCLTHAEKVRTLAAVNIKPNVQRFRTMGFTNIEAIAEEGYWSAVKTLAENSGKLGL